MKGKILVGDNLYITNLQYDNKKLNYLWLGSLSEDYFQGSLSSIKNLKRLKSWIETIIKNRKKKNGR